MTTADEAVDLVKDLMWPALKAERDRVANIDKWYRWEHDKPKMPTAATPEYKELADRAQAPWGRRIVTAVTDQLYVEGYRSHGQAADDETDDAAAGDTDANAAPWGVWQANGFDARQIAVHEAAIAYGLSYVTVLPGETMTGEKIPVLRGLDPSQMIAVYEDPAWDDWPEYALRVQARKIGGENRLKLWLFDDTEVHLLTAVDDLEKLEYGEVVKTHKAGVCPVSRYTNRLDLRGRADGEVEPFIPLLGRIDQTTFDRLVVQRFASWVVRTVSGMAPPDDLPEGESEEQWRRRTALILKVSDFLAADDPDTKWGSLPATPLDGFIAAHDADVRALAAVSQSPAHELLAQMSNLSAESLAAAEASLTRKVERTKHMLGESHERTLRLSALIAGDTEGAKDVSAQVAWRDMESRSLAQAADALGKLATMLGVPVEILWEKVPGFTQQDVERAKDIVKDGGGMDKLIAALNPVPDAA